MPAATNDGIISEASAETVALERERSSDVDDKSSSDESNDEDGETSDEDYWDVPRTVESESEDEEVVFRFEKKL